MAAAEVGRDARRQIRGEALLRGESRAPVASGPARLASRRQLRYHCRFAAAEHSALLIDAFVIIGRKYTRSTLCESPRN